MCFSKNSKWPKIYITGSYRFLRQICSLGGDTYVCKVSSLYDKQGLRYACSKFAISNVCYSATYRPRPLRLCPALQGLSLYQCAKLRKKLPFRSRGCHRLPWQNNNNNNTGNYMRGLPIQPIGAVRQIPIQKCLRCTFIVTIYLRATKSVPRPYDPMGAVRNLSVQLQ